MNSILVDMLETLRQLIRDLPEPEAQQLADALSDAVLETLAIAIMQSVPDQKLSEFESLVSARDFPALTAFLKQHVPLLDKNLAEGLARMRSETQTMLSAQSL